jgi:beta-lactamase superfamily II metal-dependent hydrolase
MEFVIDFLYVGDGDGIIIWGRNPNENDFVFFLDGGNTDCGKAIVTHYKHHIKPNLYQNKIIGFISSHPHADHINGLIEIVEEIGNEMSWGIYNDPVKFITEELRGNIKRSALKQEDPDIEHLYKSFKKVQELNELCEKHGIVKKEALTDSFSFEEIKIVSPSREFYTDKVQQFTNIDFLKKVDFTKKAFRTINEFAEGLKPCEVVDEKSDASPENLTATVIELVDSKNRRYLLTSDSGVESFDDMEQNGFQCKDLHIVQLPHHGGRRNISTDWISKFAPDMFIISAEGNEKHPRKAVLSCIKKNLKNCSIYSTHKSKSTLSYTTNRDVFPDRHWKSAEPL